MAESMKITLVESDGCEHTVEAFTTDDGEACFSFESRTEDGDEATPAWTASELLKLIDFAEATLAVQETEDEESDEDFEDDSDEPDDE
jgi:hypothetical protein